MNNDPQNLDAPSQNKTDDVNSSPRTLIIDGDKISLCVLQLRFLFNEVELATGSGFIYERDKFQFLITNWHNVSGRNPISKHCLSPTLGTPNKITFRLRPNPMERVWREVNIPLYVDANSERPRWIEHPILRESVDVVAIPLPQHCIQWLNDHQVAPINSIRFNDRHPIRVTDDCFVVGFPFASEPKPLLPIWKRASIASEPDIDLDRLPKLLIDTATRSGLSGSPVIMRRVGVHGLKADGSIAKDTEFGEIQRFLGVYSNRIGKGEELAQLGVVWKARVIDEIISSAVDKTKNQ